QFPALLDRVHGGLGNGPFGPRPGLRLAQQGPQLGEQIARQRLVAIERLDSLEAVQHASRLLHSPTVAGWNARDRGKSAPPSSRRARPDGEVARRSRAEPEQRIVEGREQSF